MFTRKQIWSLLIPLMIEQLLLSLMGTADTMMVSRAGSAAVSAVSLVDSINILIIYVFSAIATGGSILCAQYLGNRDLNEANDTGRQLMLSVFFLSSAVMVTLVLVRGPLLKLIFGSVEPLVMQNANTYFLITVLSYPFIALYNGAAALFRVDGNSRLPMIISTAANCLNVALNALFIFCFHMGVVGAALATLISRVLCSVVVLYQLRKPRQNIVVRDYLRIRPNFSRIGRIMAVGVPTGVENGMFHFGKLAIQSTVSTLSTTAIAAQAITQSLELMGCYAQLGMGLGMMTIVGQCMGAGRREEARRYILQITGYSEIVTIIVCILLAVLVKPVTILAGLEPEAADLTRRMVYLICIVKPLIWNLAFVPPHGLRAAGDVRFAMLLSSLSMWLCRVAVTVILIRVLHLGILGVWLGMFADWAVRAVGFTLRFFSGRWSRKKII